MKKLLLLLICMSGGAAYAGELIPAQGFRIGEGIAEFMPEGHDSTVTPDLIISNIPETRSPLPPTWNLIPTYELVPGGVSAFIDICPGTSLYGGGEVTGPLLRNGKEITMWNCDTPAYGVDNGTHLYQTHPWIMGVRADGTAFGIIFDSFHKTTLTTENNRVTFTSPSTPFRTYIIDRQTPQDVLKGLAELTGTMEMPPLWSLGYHQCRFSYFPEAKVMDIASTFRKKNIPCDVIWFDIHYMDGFRVFTFDNQRFPDPARMNRFLHDNGFKSVYMIDPGVCVDPAYSVYASGKAADVFIKDAYGKEYHGKVWPDTTAFPDFTRPEVRKWWSSLYKDFLATGIDGVWNDMNEPSVFSGPNGTLPESCMHLGGGNLPAGRHGMWHNAYGRLMVEASRNGIMTACPDKRPFILSRSNILGGQRFAAMWTGDNFASEDQMRLSIPMSLTVGLSGQPFNGPDIGGFLGNTSPELFGQWIGFGAFFPFARGHACDGTNDKEPWAFTPDVEKEARMAIERRYRLIPYLYTLFHKAHTDGQPVMSPVFFADPTDLSLRGEEQAFMLGENLIVIPSIARNPSLPKGKWEQLSLVKGDTKGKYQAELKARGGSIIPLGEIVQNLNENPLSPLTLIVCPDDNGHAEETLYWDAGDGWEFRDGAYAMVTFEATVDRKGKSLEVSVKDRQGNYPLPLDKVRIELLDNGGQKRVSGSLLTPLHVRI